MLGQIELALFILLSGTYLVSWGSFLLAWKSDSNRAGRFGAMSFWLAFILHAAFILLRAYRADHIPVLTAYEFVTAFAFLVAAAFLLSTFRNRNQTLGVFLLPVILCLLLYASLTNRVIEPEIPIFDGFLLKVHVVTVLVAYAAWAITFAASVSFLYLERKKSSRDYLTFITWLIFLAYLHSRYNRDWEGHRAAILAIVGFAAVVFTYVGVDFFLPHLASLGMDRMTN
jgi:ABC-type transport system involved in cytochrome c biogenesis permease subunit